MTKRLEETQKEALRPFVEGQGVHDLGAGDMNVAIDLVLLGAKQVVAVDREEMSDPGVPCIERVQCHYHDFHDPVDTVLMSWPINHDCGLIEIAQRSRVVIYLGKNSGGNACGTPTLFRYLGRREILLHVPEFRHTLIVYGPQHRDRPLLPDEYAAIHQERMWQYDELMAERWTSRAGRLLWEDLPGV